MAAAPRIVPTVQNPDLLSVTILVDGTEISRAYQLLSVMVTTAINKIPGASLTILDGEPNREDFPVSDGGVFLPGKAIEIKAGYHQELTTIFRGIIISNTHKISNNGAELQVECKD